MTGSDLDVDSLRAAGRAAGLVAVGVAKVERFDDVRSELLRRRDSGLHAGMQFTYRDPDRSTDPARLLPGARSLVVGALPYAAGMADRQEGPGAFGRIARYAVTDHYGELRRALGRVAALLEAGGARTRIVIDDNGLVDRAAAHRAGIGWWGHNSNLLVPGHGSWVLLGAIVTDVDLPASTPVDDGCGSCRRCLDGCPTAAIIAPGVIDARRCLAWLVQAEGSFPEEFRAALGDRVYGCDDCQEVCPPSRRAPASGVMVDGAGDGGGAWVDLRWMLTASDEELLDRHGRWYVPRRDPRYLRRNALIAMGNAGDPHDPSVRTAVERWSRSDDEMLAEHARWALDQLDRRGHEEITA